jgi:hypothetical protein
MSEPDNEERVENRGPKIGVRTQILLIYPL